MFGRIFIFIIQICLHDGPMIDPDSRDSISTEHLKLFIANIIRLKIVIT